MKAKPFIKWVGGKTQLIDQLEALLPADFDKWENVTYIEPFVGMKICDETHIERSARIIPIMRISASIEQLKLCPSIKNA